MPHSKGVGKFLFPVFVIIVCTMIIQSCQKSMDPADRGAPELSGKKKPKNPPPPPPPFYFNNCTYPGPIPELSRGVPVNINFTLTYVNSPGGSYPAYASTTMNGITVTAPAGTLSVGTGSIVFTLSGTPLEIGIMNVWINLAGANVCPLYVFIVEPPANPATCGGDPGPTQGSLGCVSFNYRGQNVTYYTVRARDGKIWLRQNLGSARLAINAYDEPAFGDLFQWGRWDDGHQVKTSPVISGSSSIQNPSHIASGNPSFIQNNWWSTGVTSDTWSGTTVTATNGKDPCAALGAGWRTPSLADWQGVSFTEDITSTISAYMSNLKLPAAGLRYGNGGFYPSGTGNYWSSTAASNGNAGSFAFDDNYVPFFDPAGRGNGLSCRCVKD
jgi:hypothetical protein